MGKKYGGVEGIDPREVLAGLKSANAALSEAAREIGEAADAGLEVDESYFDEGGEGYEAQKETFDLARKLEAVFAGEGEVFEAEEGSKQGEVPREVVEIHARNGEAYLMANSDGLRALTDLLNELLSYSDVSPGPITATKRCYTTAGETYELHLELAGDWWPPQRWGAKRTYPGGEEG